MRAPITHHKKSWPQFFQPIKAGTKLHDLRSTKDDDYQVGDDIVLREYDPVVGAYTGDEVRAEITFITSEVTPCAYSSHALERGYAILSLRLRT